MADFGSMTLPQLRKDLEKIGAKKTGRKKELVERYVSIYDTLCS